MLSITGEMVFFSVFIPVSNNTKSIKKSTNKYRSYSNKYSDTFLWRTVYITSDHQAASVMMLITATYLLLKRIHINESRKRANVNLLLFYLPNVNRLSRGHSLSVFL